MLLYEFDPQRDAVINPDIIHKPVEGFPETVVSIFHHALFQKIVDFWVVSGSLKPKMWMDIGLYIK